MYLGVCLSILLLYSFPLLTLYTSVFGSQKNQVTLTPCSFVSTYYQRQGQVLWYSGLLYCNHLWLLLLLLLWPPLSVSCTVGQLAIPSACVNVWLLTAKSSSCCPTAHCWGWVWLHAGWLDCYWNVQLWMDIQGFGGPAWKSPVFVSWCS